MKGMKLMTVILAVAMITLGVSSMAFAYHDGGVAYCEGCHTMHNSINDAAVTTTAGAVQFNGQVYLLKGSDQSSTCLNCHANANPGGYHIMTPGMTATSLPVQMTPGGDFGWLQVAGGAGEINGVDHGHDIIAADFGLTGDARYTTSPGGSYPAGNLYCSSCHDPHGKYRQYLNGGTLTMGAPTIGSALGPIISSGSYGAVPDGFGNAVGVYRLLAGVNYLPDSVSGTPAAQFTNPSPFAVAPSTYNIGESNGDTRVAYGGGMSEWCANCHGQMQNVGAPDAPHEHPAGDNAGAELNQTGAQGWTLEAGYNAYVKSGDLTGTQATSYSSLVPYEENITYNTANIAALAAEAGDNGSASKVGPATGGTEVVMCLSCHRAHASAWFKGVRWNPNSEYLTENGAYPDYSTDTTYGKSASEGMTSAQIQRAYYERPATRFASYQRQMCNKCHTKD